MVAETVWVDEPRLPAGLAMSDVAMTSTPVPLAVTVIALRAS